MNDQLPCGVFYGFFLLPHKLPERAFDVASVTVVLRHNFDR